MNINYKLSKDLVALGVELVGVLTLGGIAISEIVKNHKLRSELLAVKLDNLYKDTTIHAKDDLIKYYEEHLKETLNK